MDILLYFILPTLTLALGTLSFISLKRFFRTIKTELKTGKENKQQIEIYTKLWKETQNEYAREKAYILLLEDYALDVDKIFRYTFLAGVLFLFCSSIFVSYKFPEFIYGTKAYYNEIKKDSAWAERNIYSNEWNALYVESKKYQFGTKEYDSLGKKMDVVNIQYEKAQKYYESLPD